MHILALEPYYRGSHRAFLDDWITHSEHPFTLLTHPGRHWKWRMHHAGLTLGREAQHLDGPPPDLLFASSMLDLPTFLGCAPASLQTVPRILYFHENQFTYPRQPGEPADHTYGCIQFKSAAVADAVWFNSTFHRDAFLAAARSWLERMPDPRPLDLLDRIAERSAVQPPGIPVLSRAPRDPSAPPHLLWAARWEYDKDPDTLFDALAVLVERDIDFRISVLGESFAHSPPRFAEAQTKFADRIVHWGWLENRNAYLQALGEADLFLSTARQEFFGIAVMEAAAAGGFPCLPQRLAYPDVFSPTEHPDFYYDGTAAGLADRLEAQIARVNQGTLWGDDPDRARRCVAPLAWPQRAAELDRAALMKPQRSP